MNIVEKINSDTKFDFNDILIKPATVSEISSRKQIDPYYDGFLPLITAPMDTVITSKNEFDFYDNKIHTCLPRGYWPSRGWRSVSLDEIKRELGNKMRNNEINTLCGDKILIDIANGHMKDLASFIPQLKTFTHITLMVGNIANPETYAELSNAGADYVRIGIGNGGGCSTTVHTGVGYPMASLIRECYDISLTLQKPAKIVADGGMQTYSDIIKALALGADYVMLGSMMNKAIESSGDNYLFGFLKVPRKVAEFAYKNNISVTKKFRGMSTKEVQRAWGKETLTTSEGVIRFRKVEYSLKKWTENFEAYLRSAMSYSNCLTLEEFIGKANIIKITNNAYNRFNK